VFAKICLEGMLYAYYRIWLYAKVYNEKMLPDKILKRESGVFHTDISTLES
jgi:hypothetical protein